MILASRLQRVRKQSKDIDKLRELASIVLFCHEETRSLKKDFIRVSSYPCPVNKATLVVTTSHHFSCPEGTKDKCVADTVTV